MICSDRGVVIDGDMKSIGFEVIYCSYEASLYLFGPWDNIIWHQSCLFSNFSPHCLIKGFSLFYTSFDWFSFVSIVAMKEKYVSLVIGDICDDDFGHVKQHVSVLKISRNLSYSLWSARERTHIDDQTHLTGENQYIVVSRSEGIKLLFEWVDIGDEGHERCMWCKECCLVGWHYIIVGLDFWPCRDTYIIR